VTADVDVEDEMRGVTMDGGRGPMGALLIVVTMAMVAAAGCRDKQPREPRQAPPAADPQAAALERASQAADGLKRGLMRALTGALREGAPAALDVCKDQAPALAARESVGGVLVGRTSDRLRNPDNAPRGWVKPLLEEYARTPRADAPPHRLVELDGGGYGYVEPIYLMGMCTGCHGTAVTPEVTARLEALYPDDAATGYQPDDLRGLIWVEVSPRARRP